MRNLGRMPHVTWKADSCDKGELPPRHAAALSRENAAACPEPRGGLRGTARHLSAVRWILTYRESSLVGEAGAAPHEILRARGARRKCHLHSRQNRSGGRPGTTSPSVRRPPGPIS